MIKAIRHYFDRHIGKSGNAGTATSQRRLQLAAAALLIEMARVDYDENPQELEQITGLLQTHFSLSDDETRELVELASEEADQMTSYYQFTSTINKECDIIDKTHILKLLWQVAYADGRVDRFEQHLLSKITSLLYIPREQMVAARRAAEKDVGITG